LPKIPQEYATANGITIASISRSNHPPPRQQRDLHPSPVVDLSDVVGDFEATLKRSCKSSKIFDHRLITETGKILFLLSIKMKTIANVKYILKYCYRIIVLFYNFL